MLLAFVSLDAAELEVKRDEDKRRRDTLFAAVDQARQERQAARAARQAALAALAEKATAHRDKVLQATADKGRCQVRHALAVAAAVKEQERAVSESTVTNLTSRLEAASTRRHDLRHSVGSARAVSTLRYKASVASEEKRAKFAREMDLHLCRRTAQLGARTSKVASENARIAQVVSDVATMRELHLQAMNHNLCTRLQHAAVNRAFAQKAKLQILASAATGVPAPPISTFGSHAPSGDYIQWFGPDGGAGRVGPKQYSGEGFSPFSELATCATPNRVIVIDTTDVRGGLRAPPSALLARLLFCPRLLLATAKSRHSAAAGRRQVVRNLIQARATHFGTVRVAEACGRRAAMTELRASISAAKEQRASLLATEAVARVAARARHFNERGVAAKMRLSHLRLCQLDRAISGEEKRHHASMRHTQRLLNLKANRYERAAQMAARARRAQASATRAASHAHAAMRMQAAFAARSKHLKSAVEVARAMACRQKSERAPVAMPSASGAELDGAATRPEGGATLRSLAKKLSHAHAAGLAAVKSQTRTPATNRSGIAAVRDRMGMDEEKVLAAEARQMAAIEGAVAAMMCAMRAKVKLDSTVESAEDTNPLRSLGQRLRKHADETAFLAQLHQVDADKTEVDIVEEAESNVEPLVLVGTAMSIHENASSDAATEDWQLV